MKYDICVITVRDEHQMGLTIKELEWRYGLLPAGIRFQVFPDHKPEIGSGSSTIGVLHELQKHYDLDEMKILIIHSGGKSEHLPFCHVGGKIFMPFPSEEYYTMFDFLPVNLSNLPTIAGCQVIISPCDSFITCNPEQLALSTEGVTVIASKGTHEEAERFGHFTVRHQPTGNLSEAQQFSYHAEYEMSFQEPKPFWIDTGIVHLAGDAVKTLLSMKSLYQEILEGKPISLYNQLYQSLLGAPLLGADISKLKFAINTVQSSTFYHLGSTKEFIETFCLLNQNRSWESVHA